MNKDKALKALEEDFKIFKKLPKKIRDDVDVKNYALSQAIDNTDDQWEWSYYLLNSKSNNLNQEDDYSNDDSYLTLKLAEISHSNITYLSSISKKLRNDINFFKALYEIRPKNFGWGYLEYASKKVKSNREIAISAIKAFPGDFFYLDQSLYQDHKILATALELIPNLVNNVIFTESLLVDKDFTSLLNKKTKNMLKACLTQKDAFRSKLPSPQLNLEPLTEDEFKMFIFGFIQIFLFSEDCDNQPFNTFSSELKNKLESIFTAVSFYDWPLLVNIPAQSLVFDAENELVDMALKNYSEKIISFSSVYFQNISFNKVYTKLCELGIELLAQSSLVEDGQQSDFEALREETQMNIFSSFNLTNQTQSNLKQRRWKKNVANLFLRKCVLWRGQFDLDEFDCPYDNPAYYELLQLVSARFKANRFVFSTGIFNLSDLLEGDELSAELKQNPNWGGTSLDSIISLNRDISMEKYYLITEHFDNACAQKFTNLVSMKALFEWLYREYGLTINFLNNNIFLKRNKLIKFQKFKSKLNLDDDFLSFLRKDLKNFAGIKSKEDFNLEYLSQFSSLDGEESNDNIKAKIGKDGYEFIDPQHPELGLLSKVEFDDLWSEIQINLASPVDGKYLNKEKEFMFFPDETSSIQAFEKYISLAVSKLEESQKTGSYSIQQSEIPMMRKGRILIDNMTDNIQNIGLLEDSAEMGYALELCLKTEILFYLKHDDSIDEVAAYKYSSDQFSIEENLYSQIIKVFVVKFKNGDCEMMALPFFRR